MTVFTEPTPNGTANNTKLANGTNNRDPAPTHPCLVCVHRGTDAAAYDTYSTSEVDLPAGALFAPIIGWTPAFHPTYATVQTGPTTHLNLNSDLLYINHSCAPSLEFHVSAAEGIYEVRVAKDRALKNGDVLTFFYPSTEWDMAQKFECKCGEKGCWGIIGGAGEMSQRAGAVERLREYWVNEHIRVRI